MKRKPEGGAIHIEEIQDQVELALMRGGEHEVARAYVLYREKRAQERAHEKQTGQAPKPDDDDLTSSRTACASRSTWRGSPRSSKTRATACPMSSPSASSRRR